MTVLLFDPDKAYLSLAPYATKVSRGRLTPEKPSSQRTAFQRDRDRIIHSGAFRKLRNKTQVFIEDEGDYYRTRLTHSLEVAQIARTAARYLCLNEDLAETIALAHDLGHTCFGHAGEQGVSDGLGALGHFNHNDQTFRILTKLESPYVAFEGLNLTWESLEGIVKHNGPLHPLPTGYAPPETIMAFDAVWSLELDRFAGLEAQIAAIADDIAYNTHDVDDGFRAGLLTFSQIRELPLFGPALGRVQKDHPGLPLPLAVKETIREVIGLLVQDLLTTAQANLARLQPRSVEDVYAAGEPIAVLSAIRQAEMKVIHDCLMANLYHAGVVDVFYERARAMTRDLFEFFMDHPERLPPDWFAPIQEAGEKVTEAFKARLIVDYIAGMTDPFALRQYAVLLGEPEGFSEEGF